MRMRRILVIAMVTIMLVGCGKVDEKITPSTSDKKKETVVEKEMVDEIDEVSGKEDEGTTEDLAIEVVEETTAKCVSTEQTYPEETQKAESKKTEQKKVQTNTETPAPTTPVASEPTTSMEAETKVEECNHWYQPVETEEYDMISHYVFASNCCGYPLFTIENRDAVNIPDLYVHPDSLDEESGITCTKKFTSWHSEYFYSGFCYCCHSRILLRTCTVFYVRAEQCVENEGVLGEYEKVEPGHAYIESCDCGQNILMSGALGKGMMLKKEECCYCGDTKSYP